MNFKSKNSLTSCKSRKELTDFLKSQTTKEIQKTSFLGDKSYQLSDDYDRFILSKQAKELARPGFFEINAYLKVNEIDEHSSQVDYTIRYSDIALFIVVTIHIAIVLITLLVPRINLFQNSIILSSFFGRFVYLVVLISILNFCLWLGIKTTEDKFKEIIEELIQP
jgi:hypothetical protein